MKATLITLWLLILFGETIFQTNPTFAAGSTNSVSFTNELSPFQITITPRKTRVHVMEPFKVALQVKNVSNTNQSFVVMSCSWYENWHSNNRLIGWNVWNCLSNFGYSVKLAPGEVFKQELNGNEKELCVYEKTSTNKVSFRMELHSGNFNDPSTYSNFRTSKFYSSNEVTIDVISD